MSLIYVQIPAYRDAELPKTLASLYRRAERPAELRVRVVWQHGPDERLPAPVLALPNLEIDAVPAAQSEGCNWARQRLQAGWAGEPYTLLIDSHHRFVTGWDTQALAMLRGIRCERSERPLLTAYLPSYDPSHPRRRRLRPYKVYPLRREEGLLTRLTSWPIRDWSRLQHPIKADFVSLHFILADGAFNRDVPIDPDVYFFGDEVQVSLRSFAAGYRFFHPHRVLGWHAYDRATRRPHWDDHPDWIERNRRSMELLGAAYRSTARIGASDATVADFERYAGVELASR